MARIKIVLADEDEVYQEHMARYFMSKSDQCEIFTFSSQKSLLKYLSASENTDVLLLDPKMICDELQTFNISVKILLSDTDEKMEGYESVKKYQKTEEILKKVLLKYAEITGRLDAVKGKRKTRVIGFYSPVGGSGKTTIALNTAAACAGAGMQVFYLNLEKSDSTSSIFGKTPGTMSDVFLSMKTKGTDLGVRILAARGEESHTKIHYISAPDSISEYSELTMQEFDTLIKAIINLNEYDVLVLDFSSEFNQEKIYLMENCDLVFAPIVSDEFSINRIKTLLHENTLHQEYSSFIKKLRLVLNKADISGASPALTASGILEQCPLMAVITMAPTFMNQQNLLSSAEIVRQVFEPLVNCIQETANG